MNKFLVFNSFHETPSTTWPPDDLHFNLIQFLTHALNIEKHYLIYNSDKLTQVEKFYTWRENGIWVTSCSFFPHYTLLTVASLKKLGKIPKMHFNLTHNDGWCLTLENILLLTYLTIFNFNFGPLFREFVGVLVVRQKGELNELSLPGAFLWSPTTFLVLDPWVCLYKISRTPVTLIEI